MILTAIVSIFSGYSRISSRRILVKYSNFLGKESLKFYHQMVSDMTTGYDANFSKDYFIGAEI